MLFVGGAISAPAAQAATYEQIIGSHSGLALVVQQGKVQFAQPDATRFNQQWEKIDVRPDGTFLLRNRGALDSCLSRDTSAPPELQITVAKVVSCAGTNAVSKRWSQPIASIGPVRYFLLNAETQHYLTQFQICFITCPSPESPTLLSPEFRESFLDTGSPPGNFSWRFRRV
jgi:hypothetical protein